MRSYCYILRHRAREEASVPYTDTFYATSKSVHTTTYEKSYVDIKRHAPTDTAKCIYCTKDMSLNGLTYHQV